MAPSSLTTRFLRLFLAFPQRLRIRAAPGWMAETGQELSRILGVEPGFAVKESIQEMHSPSKSEANVIHASKQLMGHRAEADTLQINKISMKRYKFSPALLAPRGSRSTWIVKNIDMRQAMDLVARTRTAFGVKWIIIDTICENHSQLKKLMYSIPFDIFFSRFEVSDVAIIAKSILTARASGSFANSSKLLYEMFEEALLAFASSSTGPARPASTQSDIDRLGFHIALEYNRLQVSVDLGGGALYKRGYKASLSATAPLPEHIAAAAFQWILQAAEGGASKWSRNGLHVIHVPFAGSGTLGFESALELLQVPPGAAPRRLRSFGYEHFAAAPEPTLRNIRERCEAYKRDFWRKASINSVHIQFSDINGDVIDTLTRNIQSFENAFVPNRQLSEEESKRFVAFARQKDFFDDNITWSSKLFGHQESKSHHYLLLNPPRGLRLGKATEPQALYARIGYAAASMAKALLSSGGVQSFIGYCIIPDEISWKVFCRHVTSGGILRVLQTRHFSQGGRDLRIVAFESVPS